MKLYEINQELKTLLSSMVDEETGEYIGTDEMLERIDALQATREDVLRDIAKEYQNTGNEAEMLYNEEQRLRHRRQKLETKQARLLEILDRECDGQKTDLGVATLSYRKTNKLEVVSKSVALDWLEKNYDSCVKYSEPEIRKDEVKKLIKSGVNVPGCEIVEGRSVSLK